MSIVAQNAAERLRDVATAKAIHHAQARNISAQHCMAEDIFLLPYPEDAAPFRASAYEQGMFPVAWVEINFRSRYPVLNEKEVTWIVEIMYQSQDGSRWNGPVFWGKDATPVFDNMATMLIGADHFGHVVFESPINDEHIAAITRCIEACELEGQRHE